MRRKKRHKQKKQVTNVSTGVKIYHLRDIATKRSFKAKYLPGYEWLLVIDKDDDSNFVRRQEKEMIRLTKQYEIINIFNGQEVGYHHHNHYNNKIKRKKLKTAKQKLEKIFAINF